MMNIFFSSHRVLNKSIRLLGMSILAIGACFITPKAHALDWQLSAGSGDRAGINKLGVGLVLDPHPVLWQGASWHMRLLHEAQLAYWDTPKASNIIELGYSPMLRLQRTQFESSRWSLFLEAGIGVRLLSHPRLSPSVTMSTAFQFSDTIGFGVQFGTEGRQTLGVRLQHLSNASIKAPNPGINFTQLYYQQRF